MNSLHPPPSILPHSVPGDPPHVEHRPKSNKNQESSTNEFPGARVELQDIRNSQVVGGGEIRRTQSSQAFQYV